MSYLTYLHLLQTPSNHVLGGRNLANPVVNVLAVCMQFGQPSGERISGVYVSILCFKPLKLSGKEAQEEDIQDTPPRC